MRGNEVKYTSIFKTVAISVFDILLSPLDCKIDMLRSSKLQRIQGKYVFIKYQVLFRESPAVSYLNRDTKMCGSDACYHCHAFIDDNGAAVPCPTCSAAVFCSLRCRKTAYGTYHKYECRLGPVIR